MKKFEISNPSELGNVIKIVRKSKRMSQMSLYEETDIYIYI